MYLSCSWKSGQVGNKLLDASKYVASVGLWPFLTYGDRQITIAQVNHDRWYTLDVSHSWSLKLPMVTHSHSLSLSFNFYYLLVSP